MAGIADFLDFSNPQFLGLLQGLGQAGMPSRMPVPFGAVMGGAAQGLMQGQQFGLQQQLAQQRLLGGKQELQKGDLELQNAKAAQQYADQGRAWAKRSLEDIDKGRTAFGLSSEAPSPPEVPPVLEPAAPPMPSPLPMHAAPAASRGMRNNNPLNLTTLPTGAWDGQVGHDGHFAVFDSPESGLKAADQNLQAYGTKHGINTLTGIINRWAPSSENNTTAYVATVARDLGIDPVAPLNLGDPNVRHAVLQSMAKVELGGSPPVLAQAPPSAVQAGQPAAAAVPPEPAPEPATAQPAVNVAAASQDPAVHKALEVMQFDLPHGMAMYEKAMEPYSLSPGQHRFAGGAEVAHVAPQGVVMNAGAHLKDPITGREIANVPARPEHFTANPTDDVYTVTDGKPQLFRKGEPGDVATPLTDDAVEAVASAFAQTGVMPPLGMGKAATQNRDKVINKYAEMLKETGLTGADAAQKWQVQKATKQALSTATRLRSMTEGYENTALRAGDLAMSLAPKGTGPTGRPIFDRWINAGRKATGDPDVTAFQNALGTFADEYAKVVSGGTGGQALTDSARAEAYRRFDTAANMQQLQANIGVLRQEMAFRSRSLREQEAALRDQMKTGTGPTIAPPQTPSAALAPAGQGAMPAAPKGAIAPSQADLNATAMKYHLTVSQVKDRLRAQGYTVP